VQEPIAQRQEPPVARGGDLDVVDLLALDAGDQGVLPPALDPLHGPPELHGEGSGHHVFRVVHALRAEATADIGGRHHADLLFGQTELGRVHAAVAVHHLHGCPQRELPIGPLRHQSAGLQRVSTAAG
jgi:hypothetical protein